MSRCLFETFHRASLCGSVLLTLAGGGLYLDAQTLAPGVSLTPVAQGYSRYNLESTSFTRQNLVSIGSTQYVAFYNPGTNLVVGRRLPGTTTWETNETNFKPNDPTDGHDIISIGIGSDGVLHASWGMHGDSPFHYARSAPWSLTLVATNMTGFEHSVTYPQFINMPNGDLLYLFREGTSGNGDTYINHYSSVTHAWTNQTLGTSQAPFIRASGPGSATNANAYPNYAGFDSQTNLHLTWTWREDASSIDWNHDECYARSPDFGATWRTWSNMSYTLPITKDTAQIVWPVPLNSQLMNQCGQTIDTNDRPVIATWWAPQGSGTAIQIFVIWNDGFQWRTNQIGTRTTTAWPTRPIIVCDQSNRLWMVFTDPERGSVPTLAWTSDPQRRTWNLINLTDQNMGTWETSYDPTVWSHDGKLDLFYQPINGLSDGTQISVMEFDPAVFLANQPAPPQTFEWTNMAGGNWNVPANWTNGASPPVGGSNNLQLQFTGTTGYIATNDFAGNFSLNQALLNANGAGTNRLAGNPLVFTNNGTSLSALTQSGSAAFAVANPLTLGATLSVALDSAASVSLNGGIAGSGGISVSGSGQLILSASNIFTGGINLGSGTVAFGTNSLGSGPLAAGGGTLRWLPGNALDICAGRAVTLTGTVNFDPGGNTVPLSGGIGGSGGLTLSAGNGGTLVLTGSNSYSGLTTINTGMLVASASAALGSTANFTTPIGGTATSSLGIQGGISLAEPIRCGGRQPFPNASALAAHVVNLAGTNTLTGDITAEMGGNQYNIESASGRLIVAGNYSQVSGTGDRYLNLQGAGDANWTGAINDGTGIINLTKRGPGRWVLSGTNTFSGTTTVSAGTLLVNGVLGTNTVTVSNNATLGGNGIINGATTVQDGGTLAPGNSIGTLTVGNDLVFASGSRTVMEIYLSPLTNDEVVVSRALALGGTLIVTNLSTQPLFAGDSFQLFSASNITGSFANVVLPPLNRGLAWTNTLAGNGSIAVIATVSLNPTNIAFATTNGGATLVLSWPQDHLGWRLQAQTNPPDIGLSTNWFEVAGSPATNRVFVPIDASLGDVFYRLILQ